MSRALPRPGVLRRISLVALAATALLLSACGQPGSTDPVTTTTSTTTEPTMTEPTTTEPTTTEPTTTEPTTEPPEPPAVRPEYASLVVTHAGIGHLVIGAPVPELPKSASMVKWNPNYCDPEANPGSQQGQWVSTYPAVAGYFGGTVQPFAIAAAKKSAPITWIEVFATDLFTDQGVGLGTSFKQLKQAYPDLVRTSTSDTEYTARVFASETDEGVLAFEVLKEYGGPLEGTVGAIHVLPPGGELTASTLGTDNLPNSCL